MQCTLAALLWSALGCTELCCHVLHCSALQYSAVHCIALQCIEVQCSAVQSSSVRCTTLHCAVCLHPILLTIFILPDNQWTQVLYQTYYITVHCRLSVVLHSALHCSPPYYTALHCTAQCCLFTPDPLYNIHPSLIPPDNGFMLRYKFQTWKMSPSTPSGMV